MEKEAKEVGENAEKRKETIANWTEEEREGRKADPKEKGE